MGGFEAKECYFQLGPMGVNNLPIEGGFLPRNFICCMRRLNDGWVSVFLPKLKHNCLHGWRRGKRQIWTKHKDEGSFGCHHWPTLRLLWMVQVVKGIKNFDWVLLYIEFASTKLKMMDIYEAWCQLSMKALTCSTDCMGVKILCHPCKNHGGLPIVVEWKACLRRCWGTIITKTNPSTIESFCKGEGQILNLKNVSWHLDKHRWYWLEHFCEPWMQSNNLGHCIMICYKTSCCIFVGQPFNYLHWCVWLGGGWEVTGG